MFSRDDSDVADPEYRGGINCCSESKIYGIGQGIAMRKETEIPHFALKDAANLL
jgi:hypothetical protein